MENKTYRNRILVAERIADQAIQALEAEANVDVKIGMNREELLESVAEYDGVIVRSATQIDAELMEKAKKLKVVGRAGNGTDNIDIPEATRRGIIVANTPESNTMSAAELTVGLILTQSRNIPQANAFLKDGQWGRNQFKGTELFGKTLGIVGLGRIGSLVAKRMQAFGMNVIAYDPYISQSRFKRLDVEKKVSLEDLVKESDFITVHTPKNKETLWMINDAHLDLMKAGVRLANVARGGIIKESTILRGIQSGKIASAGIDVHEEEPTRNMELLACENVIVTPHLGASTIEAQINVGMTVARQVLNGLKGEIVENAVNLPALHRDELAAIKPYIDLAEKLGKMYYQVEKNANIELVKIKYYGQLAKQETGMISIAFMKGLLETVVSNRVNYINAKVVANQRGIVFEEKNIDDYYDGFTEYMQVEIKTSKGHFSLGGNLSTKSQGRLINFNGYEVDLAPGDNMIVLQNKDVPGMIGHVGAILGQENINIATMQLGRHKGGGKAIMLLNVDDKPDNSSVLKLEEHENILWARAVSLL